MKKYVLISILLLANIAASAQQNTQFRDTTDSTQDVSSKYFDAYMAMDWDKLAPMLHPDATFLDSTAQLLFGENRPVGKDAVIKNFREGYASLTSMKPKPLRTFYSGDTGVFEFDLTFGFRNRQNGITTITMPLVVVITVKEGKVISHRDYGDYREYVKQLKAAQEKASQKG